MNGVRLLGCCLCVLIMAGCGPEWNWEAQPPANSGASGASRERPRDESRADPPPREDQLRNDVERYVEGFERDDGAPKGASNAQRDGRRPASDRDADQMADGSRPRGGRSVVDDESNHRADRNVAGRTTADGDPGAGRSPIDGEPRPRTTPGRDETSAREASDTRHGKAPVGDPTATPAQPISARNDGVPDSPAITSMSVAAAPSGSGSPVESGSANVGVNQPVQPGRADSGFDDRIRALEARVATQPNDLDAQFRLRMAYLVNDQDELAMRSSPGMTQDNERLVKAVVEVMAAARTRAGRDPAEWANRQLETVNEFRAMLKEQADLRVPRVALCRETISYGDFKPFDPAEFAAGQSQQVIVYVEVDNLRREKLSTGQFCTRLTVRLSLLDRSGQEIWTRMEDTIEDLCRNQREDFFLSLIMTVPSSLNPGEYTLKAAVTDQIGGKTNENQTSFRIVSP